MLPFPQSTYCLPLADNKRLPRKNIALSSDTIVSHCRERGSPTEKPFGAHMLEAVLTSFGCTSKPDRQPLVKKIPFLFFKMCSEKFLLLRKYHDQAA